MTKRLPLRSFSLVLLFLLLNVRAFSQCSSLYTTPEFPVATHPADQHTQSWGCNLFTPTQFGNTPFTVTGIQVYVDNSFGATTYANQTIWMRHTAVASYPNANYPTTTGFTQVFTGSYSFPMSGLVTIPFNVTNFNYNGSSNVEILFENRSGTYRANEPWFRRTTSYGAGVYRSKWNGNFGFGGFPGTASDGSAVRLTYTLSLTSVGGGGCGTLLPVDLQGFHARPTPAAVLLNWETSTESGFDFFAVERSTDGDSWEELSRIPGLGGEGQHRYDFQDVHPAAGTNLYRLRMQDQNGASAWSEILAVEYAQYETGLQAWWETEDGSLEILLNAADAPGTLTLSALTGQEIRSWPVQAVNAAEVLRPAMEGLAAGAYLLQYKAGSHVSRIRILKS